MKEKNSIVQFDKRCDKLVTVRKLYIARETDDVLGWWMDTDLDLE